MEKNKRFFFKKKEKKNIFEEEAVQTPMRAIIKNFFGSILTKVALGTFVFIILSVFVLSNVFPLDKTYINSTQANVAPGMSLLSIPSKYKNDLQQISIGGTFSVGLTKDGKIITWGEPHAKILKQMPKESEKFSMIAAGNTHISAVTKSGEIVTWGNIDMMEDIPYLKVADGEPVKILSDYAYSALLSSKGKLYIWGNVNILGVKTKLIPDTIQGRIKDFALSSTNILLLMDDGTVEILGAPGTPATSIPSDLKDVVEIEITENIAFALTKDGRVTVWGDSLLDKSAIESVQGNVAHIYSGASHGLLLTKDDTLVGFGSNVQGQINIPSKFQKSGSGIEEVFTSSFQNYVKTKDGKITPFGLKGYFMGTDSLGRDVFKRILDGGRVSLTVGVIALVVSTLIAVVLGSIAGFYGKRVDGWIMRFAEMVGILPLLPIVLILSEIFFAASKGYNSTQRITFMMMIVGLIGWPSFMRMIRGAILSEREKEFVLSARALGIKERHIIMRHILPNVITLIIINLTLGYAIYLLTETGFSFLGFGVTDPEVSWGLMLGNINAQVLQYYWWQWVFPALAISLTSISVNLIGDGLRNAVDPKSNER